MFKRIDHFEIVPSDVERTVHFYTDILNFKIKFRKEVDAPPMREVIFLELGDSVLELISAQGPAPKQEDPWHVGYRGLALEVGSMDEVVKYLRDKGVETTNGPVDLGTSIRAEIRDPDGLVIELRQWK